jgi:hypothetical protein
LSAYFFPKFELDHHKKNVGSCLLKDFVGKGNSRPPKVERKEIGAPNE